MKICALCGMNIEIVGHTPVCPDFDQAIADALNAEEATRDPRYDAALKQFGDILEEIVISRGSASFSRLLESLGLPLGHRDIEVYTITAELGMRIGAGVLLQIFVEQELVNVGVLDKLINHEDI